MRGAMIMMTKRTFKLAFDDHILILSFDHSLLHAVPASYLLTAKKVDRLMSGQVEWMVTQAANETKFFRFLLWH
jgi:hypothetical protein